jgi:hypothetical protein
MATGGALKIQIVVRMRQVASTGQGKPVVLERFGFRGNTFASALFSLPDAISS